MTNHTPLPAETTGTQCVDQTGINRDCKRIEAAITANPACVDGFFGHTGASFSDEFPGFTTGGAGWPAQLRLATLLTIHRGRCP